MTNTNQLRLITIAVAIGSLLLSFVVYLVFDIIFIFFLFIPPAVYWWLQRFRNDGVRD